MSMTTEWYYQRPGAYYWIGQALGRGVDVFIPGESELIHKRLYGYEGIPKIDPGVTQRQKAVMDAVRW